MKNFWQLLTKPFTALAPLDGVTDVVFRQIITKIGKPNVLFTEFTSCDGLQSNGKERVAQSLLFKPNEQPIVAQIWGTTPQNFYKTAAYVQSLGFSGIDINMGCPIHEIIKDGACSALIKNHKLAAEVIKATKRGAPKIPVSVKTRIGFSAENIDEWIGFLLKQKLAALTVHLRTVAELSKVPAHWEFMSKIIELKNALAPETLIIGNGDITSLNEIHSKYNEYKCDGFMVGRGIFANPWMFNSQQKDISVYERHATFLQQVKLHKEIWGNTKNFANLKKFCKAYINNFPNSAAYRDTIMKAQSLAELEKILNYE